MFQKFDLEKGEFVFECLDTMSEEKSVLSINGGMKLEDFGGGTDNDYSGSGNHRWKLISVRVITPVAELIYPTIHDSHRVLSSISFYIKDVTPQQFTDWLAETYSIKFKSKDRDFTSIFSRSKKFETKYYATFPWGEISCRYEFRDNEPEFTISWL